MHATVGGTITQHDQPGRDKTVIQHLDVAPLGPAIQVLQTAVCRNTQMRHRRGLPPTPYAQANHGASQRKCNACRDIRQQQGNPCQHGHAQQQQPQSARGFEFNLVHQRVHFWTS